MDDPARMLDEGDALEARLLGAGRRDRAPRHVRERVLALGAASAVAGATTSAAAASGAAKGASALGATAAAAGKWAVVAAVATGVTAVGAAIIVPPARTVAPATSAATRQSAPAAPRTPDVAPRAPAPRPSDLAAPTAVPPRPSALTAPLPAPSNARRSDLLEELAALDSARAALDSGDTDLAIRQLDRHDLDYLHGQLTPDALALRVEVYARRHDDPKVAELACAFLARYPDHPQAPKVRALAERAGQNP